MSEIPGPVLKAATAEVELWLRVDAAMRERPEIKAAHAAIRKRAREGATKQGAAMVALDAKIRAAAAAKKVALDKVAALQRERADVLEEIKRLEYAPDAATAG